MGPNGYGTLAQVLPISAGQIYVLSFYFASLGDDKNSAFSVSWDGGTLLSLSDPKTGSTFSQFSNEVKGTGWDTLQFRFKDDQGAVALDDVSVSAKLIQPPAPPRLICRATAGSRRALPVTILITHGVS